jgi:hypothetical protein
MDKRIPLVACIFLINIVFILPCYGQIILSAGGNGYVGNTGFMFGGGIAFEYWLSFSEQRAKEGMILGFGAEYISVTTEFTKTQGSGWVFPFALKYGFLATPTLNVGLGGGAALVTMDVDVRDYYGDYDISTELGAAPFAEACLTFITTARITFMAALRGGALFITDGTYPFVGVKLHVGYYIFLPEEKSSY